ncbi:SDR family NAD(P)-dependent oxidoreductase [Bradyrhizobium jicamae]|uniref:SDR family NAD(P)-dependent oxidoreductase n=1 Tax=Bradyrhizobium jicamae TaxID=280332 RepID=UPI001BAB5655|nr:SDR family NAD(P)-dependent oxidoreductase [Bradyrhizobium jicamae]MBR0751054.1 SDR family NAD(P)-dependent oxidoreductase [Bradyrhizobium jicamae]
MIEPIKPPGRKNPLLRTRLPTAPPRPRSRKSHGFTRAAAEGRFMLQCCEACGTFCYPAREACPSCLSSGLAFVDAPRRGTLLSETTARVPSDVYFRERAPWRAGLIKMDCGPIIIAHLHADCVETAAVLMSFQLDKSGQAVAFARPEGETPNMADDRQWRELTADPKFRRVLVTNGRSVVGQEAAMALKAAGAKTVFVGIAEPWRPFPGESALRGHEGIEIVALDAADEKSVNDLAADIGGKVDILVNTTEYVRAGGLLDRRGTSVMRDEIDQAYLGFVNLAQGFGPAMRMRGADGVNNAAAWVNVLSVYALANWPAFGAYSASQAACLSLSHCLRAELRPGGVKVVNLFTGPVDNEWFQTVPPPKVAPRAVASAIVSALKNGLEDVYVGDVAEEIRQRLAANPKALERELDR